MRLKVLLKLLAMKFDPAKFNELVALTARFPALRHNDINATIYRLFGLSGRTNGMHHNQTNTDVDASNCGRKKYDRHHIERLP